MTAYGYARVSTDGQTLAAQYAQLHAAGCTKIYSEKISGGRSDRTELAKLLRQLSAGDQVIVTRLDRLARSTRDLLNILDSIGKSGASPAVPTPPWCLNGQLMAHRFTCAAATLRKLNTPLSSTRKLVVGKFSVGQPKRIVQTNVAALSQPSSSPAKLH